MMAQLLLGGDNDSSTQDTPSGNDFIDIAAGFYHNIALKSDGSIVSWGRNLFHQISDTPSGNDFIDIAAGGDHSIALKSVMEVLFHGEIMTINK